VSPGSYARCDTENPTDAIRINETHTGAAELELPVDVVLCDGTPVEAILLPALAIIQIDLRSQKLVGVLCNQLLSWWYNH